jgi:hypothetical protein
MTNNDKTGNEKFGLNNANIIYYYFNYNLFYFLKYYKTCLKSMKILNEILLFYIII